MTRSDVLASAMSDRGFIEMAEALGEPFPLSPSDEPKVSFFCTFYYGYMVGKHGVDWERAVLDILDGTEG